MENCGHCHKPLPELPHWQHMLYTLIDEHLEDLRLENGAWLLPTIKNTLSEQFRVLLQAYGKKEELLMIKEEEIKIT